jgi:hypothetical protein
VSVYVDDMHLQATVGRLRGRWSHLTADTEAELRDFGAKIGMRPEWLQHPGTYQFHFDVMDSKRERAITLGAIPITTWELAEKCMARRLI